MKYENFEDNQSVGAKPKKRWRFFKFLVILVLASLMVIAATAGAVRLAVGPIVNNINGLPDDLPAALSFLDNNGAQTQIPTDAGKKLLVEFVKNSPDWLIDFALERLPEDIKNQIFQSLVATGQSPSEINAANLKKIILESDLQNIQTAAIVWDNIGKSKEEIAAFFKKELAGAGFGFKENLADYQIDLTFFQDGIFGNVAISDDPNNSADSDAEMTVNYLKEQQ